MVVGWTMKHAETWPSWMRLHQGLGDSIMKNWDVSPWTLAIWSSKHGKGNSAESWWVKQQNLRRLAPVGCIHSAHLMKRDNGNHPLIIFHWNLLLHKFQQVARLDCQRAFPERWIIKPSFFNKKTHLSIVSHDSLAINWPSTKTTTMVMDYQPSNIQTDHEPSIIRIMNY